jgi:hypothetical protein
LHQDFEQVNPKKVVLIPFFSAVNNVRRTVDNWVDCHLYRKENKPIKLVFIGVRVTQSLFFLCNALDIFCLSFWPFLVIVLSVLRFTDSDYPFGTFKLFTINKTSWIYNCIPSS